MRCLTPFLLFVLSGVSLAQPEPEYVTGSINVHDPTMCKDANGKYFLFATGKGIRIRTSTDRVNWTYEGLVWPDGAPWTDEFTKKSNGDLWAPDCNYVDGTFYLYYSASTSGSQNSGIFLAKSSTGMPGSFEHLGLVAFTKPGENDYNAIDPNLIIDCGEWYLTMGSYWNGIKGVPVAAGAPILETNNLDSLAARTGNPRAIEASAIFNTYNIRVGRSKTLTGGYVDADGVPLTKDGGTVILKSHGDIIGPGGQDILMDDDGPILVYHYYTVNGPMLGINHLDFSSGWPVVV